MSVLSVELATVSFPCGMVVVVSSSGQMQKSGQVVIGKTVASVNVSLSVEFPETKESQILSYLKYQVTSNALSL